jgi:uncharacterized protein (DUF1015 family)
MAIIAPFRALRYDARRVPDLARVLAPPYDVISPAQRAVLAEHDRNVVHLDLPSPSLSGPGQGPGHGQGDDKYENARRQLDQWMADGTLREDSQPAIYRYEQSFTFNDGAASHSYTRQGFIALILLSPFADGVVLPHEHTLAGPKVDRFKLIKTTSAHFSQVFALYRDPQGEAEAVLGSATGDGPAVDVATPDGCRHRLWPITDPAVIARVRAVLAKKSVMIADGHHRYETMLAVRDAIRPGAAAPGASQADFGPMFFARAEDPGLLVLPTHRMVSGLPEAALANLLERCRPWFRVGSDEESEPAALVARLRREGETTPTFAFKRAGQSGITWLALRKDADLARLGPPSLARLDVSVLHGLILEPLLGIGARALAEQSHLSYSHDLGETLRRVASAAVQAAFILNPTKVAQVLDACEAGFVLPQKSTYFEPKLATGLVMQKLRPAEPLPE